MAASPYKFHGPKGIGFVYISEDIEIKPLLRGGARTKYIFRTENIYGIAAFGKSHGDGLMKILNKKPIILKA